MNTRTHSCNCHNSPTVNLWTRATNKISSLVWSVKRTDVTDHPLTENTEAAAHHAQADASVPTQKAQVAALSDAAAEKRVQKQKSEVADAAAVAAASAQKLAAEIAAADAVAAARVHIETVKSAANDALAEAVVQKKTAEVSTCCIQKTTGAEERENAKFPVRPNAKDCGFYMKTGTCKFGMNCIYNHPHPPPHFRKTFLVGKEESLNGSSNKAKERDTCVKNGGHVDRKGGKTKGKEESINAATKKGKERDNPMNREGRVDCKDTQGATEKVKELDCSMDRGGRVDCKGVKVKVKEEKINAPREKAHERDYIVDKEGCKGGKVKGKEASPHAATNQAKKMDNFVHSGGRIKGGEVKGKELHDATDEAKKRGKYVDKEECVDYKNFNHPEGYKSGKAYKFNHNFKRAPPLKLNFMGLPIRPGEKDCPQYMRDGSCKYGEKCWHNHPEPTFVGLPVKLSSNNNGVEAISSPEVLQSTLAPSSRAGLNASPVYAPMVIPSTQPFPSQTEWITYEEHKNPNVHPFCTSTKSPSSEEEDCHGSEDVDSKNKCVKGNMNPKNSREKVNTTMADTLVATRGSSEKKIERKVSATTITTSMGDGEEINEEQSKESHQVLMKCIDALSSLGVDGASFAKATKLIHDDPIWRDIFLRMPNDRKKDWVLNIKSYD